MFVGESLVHVKRGSNIYLDEVRKLDKKQFLQIFSLAGKVRYDFFNLEEINKKHFDEVELHDITFVNTKGVHRTVTCNNNQQIHTTVRGYCSIFRLNQLDVIVDEEGFLNKLVSIESRTVKDVDLYSLSLKHNNSAFVNGIMVR